LSKGVERHTAYFGPSRAQVEDLLQTSSWGATTDTYVVYVLRTPTELSTEFIIGNDSMYEIVSTDTLSVSIASALCERHMLARTPARLVRVEFSVGRFENTTSLYVLRTYDWTMEQLVHAYRVVGQ
jgi:hypothetical protein